MSLVIAATGHRPNKLGGYGPEVFERLVRLAWGYLERKNPDSVICGMALGWDMAVGQAAIELGIPMHAAVPFDGQEGMWPKASQNYYRGLLSLAASVTVVSPGGYSVSKMQTRNEWMVNRADVLVALWDGSNGGTGNCIGYAIHNPKVAVDNLWSQWSTQ